ncbi:hypothetical protein [Fangia hongkongensis]|uniref:hypothetical protein n=1 Tax=Fangia hongkongensis TaxID=270495 RepID=UPI0003674845|nr:hypothetical protein [Fangia hongkongensis]MBK2124844.1 hypothetical protein [Fangia hongkongensis]
MDLDICRDEIVEILKETGGSVPVAMKNLREKTECDLSAAYDYCESIWEKIQKGKL